LPIYASLKRLFNKTNFFLSLGKQASPSRTICTHEKYFDSYDVTIPLQHGQCGLWLQTPDIINILQGKLTNIVTLKFLNKEWFNNYDRDSVKSGIARQEKR